MECKKCGTIIKDGEKFCGNCGEMVTYNSIDSGENKIESVVNKLNTPIEQSATVDINNNIKTEPQATSDWINNNENDSKNQKNNKGFGKILILVIIVLLLIGGILYFLNKDESESENNKNSNSKLEVDNNNKNDNDDGISFYTKINESIYDDLAQEDINLLKNYELVLNNDEFNSRNQLKYSTETYYETVLSGKTNNGIFTDKAIKLEISAGELIFSEVTLTSDNTLIDGSITTEKHNFYDCDKLKCKSQKVNLNGEKVKYLSIARPFTNPSFEISIIVLTENNNIYEGIIEDNKCQPLACQFNIELTKVNTSDKFIKIAQMPAQYYSNIISTSDKQEVVNYGLTNTGKLFIVNNSQVNSVSPIPLLKNIYTSLNLQDYEYFVYENGAIKLSNNSFILKDNHNRLLAGEIFEGTDNLYILGIDGYLYFVDSSNYDKNTSNPLIANKYSDKKIELIEYSHSNIYDGAEVKQMAVHQDPLYVNIKYIDGTTELFKIDPLTSTFYAERRFIKILQKK